ncbi:MAG: DUF3782 domain-containing protein [Desulfotomaculum sp.]|nr:DUF3782 domain-containing protein [Desulfotomaculum sp.]
MNTEHIKEIIKAELPVILRNDNEVKKIIITLSKKQFADKASTDNTGNRVDLVIEELRKDREEQREKWAEQDKKWVEQNEKWWKNQQELEKKWAEQDEKWWKNQQELDKKWAEQSKKWEKNDQRMDQLVAGVTALSKKHDATIGALGARWGLHTEASFRNAMKGILEENFKIKVLHVTEYDDAGEVFGRPDQVELDLIIKNGMLIIAEIKSSMSKSDMYVFYKKVQFYIKTHQQQVAKMIVISPMVDEKAKVLAKELGIVVYSYTEEVEL